MSVEFNPPKSPGDSKRGLACSMKQITTSKLQSCRQEVSCMATHTPAAPANQVETGGLRREHGQEPVTESLGDSHSQQG